MKLLDGKIALITGAGRGIGKTIALSFAVEGAAVVLVSRSDEIFITAADIPGSLAFKGDISDQSFVEKIMVDVETQLGGVDILVNNAAIQGPIGPLAGNDPLHWFETIRINLFGTFLCCRAALPLMKRRGGGKIINFSGGGAVSPRPNFSAYGASKTAIVRLSETLAAEVENDNIQVNAIAPGAVNTSMLDQVLKAGPLAGDEGKTAREQFISGGTPADRAAELALFFASAQSGKLSGKLISAVWDDHEDIFNNNAVLKDKDIFTLRRITERNGRS